MDGALAQLRLMLPIGLMLDLATLGSRRYSGQVLISIHEGRAVTMQIREAPRHYGRRGG